MRNIRHKVLTSLGHGDTFQNRLCIAKFHIMHVLQRLCFARAVLALLTNGQKKKKQKKKKNKKVNMALNSTHPSLRVL